MISVCIPIYNFNVNQLVRALELQIVHLPLEVEIVLIDDASTEKFKQRNQKICEKHRYIQLPKNIGRSAIRNLFTQYARFDYLLFLDCDSIIQEHDFLNNYLITINSLHPKVICGGRVYRQKRPSITRRLNWLFGVERESQSAEMRTLAPNKSFMTNNFMIQKALFEEIRFDERLSGYGHEDTLFGYELKKRGIFITHIDNPVLHGEIETNLRFLKKTEEGISNLVKINKLLNYAPDFEDDVKLLRFYRKMVKQHLRIPILVGFLLLRYPIKLALSLGFVSLWVFDFYKLGLLTKYSCEWFAPK